MSIKSMSSVRYYSGLRYSVTQCNQRLFAILNHIPRLQVIHPLTQMLVLADHPWADNIRIRQLYSMCCSALLTMFSILVETSAALELARNIVNQHWWLTKTDYTVDAARSHSSGSLTLYDLRGSWTAISLELLHLRTRPKIHMSPRLSPSSRSGAWRPPVKAPPSFDRSRQSLAMEVVQI